VTTTGRGKVYGILIEELNRTETSILKVHRQKQCAVIVVKFEEIITLDS